MKVWRAFQLRDYARTAIAAHPPAQPHKEFDADDMQEQWTAGFNAGRSQPEQQAEPQAWRDMAAERRRQVEAEGWTPEHDDEHHQGDLPLAASMYAANAASWAKHGTAALRKDYVALSPQPTRWPWASKWWKPKSQRQDLVRAAALILAEIERLDRADPSAAHPPAQPHKEQDK